MDLIRIKNYLIIPGKLKFKIKLNFNCFRELSKILFSEIYVLTLNPKNQLNRLKSVAGNKWNVFVDARVQQFLQQTSFSILACTLPSLKRIELKGFLSLFFQKKYFRS